GNADTMLQLKRPAFLDWNGVLWVRGAVVPTADDRMSLPFCGRQCRWLVQSDGHRIGVYAGDALQGIAVAIVEMQRPGVVQNFDHVLLLEAEAFIAPPLG